ncbi:hypothetical protein [[Enterobacter] lignolyticus]|uniref:hypothetical protein n=1 Tax=[Enterobacter] lignolyticus TaxID=1334193 RepID=UPI0012FF51A6|nr:hypothetical protein [[Enterobacter] lignolyticus]
MSWRKKKCHENRFQYGTSATKNVPQWNVFYDKNGKMRSLTALLALPPPPCASVYASFFSRVYAMCGNRSAGNRFPGSSFPQKRPIWIAILTLYVDLRSNMEHIIFCRVPFKNKNDIGFFVGSAPYSNGNASHATMNY